MISINWAGLLFVQTELEGDLTIIGDEYIFSFTPTNEQTEFISVRAFMAHYQIYPVVRVKI